jgi:hypothetical protein
LAKAHRVCKTASGFQPRLNSSRSHSTGRPRNTSCILTGRLIFYGSFLLPCALLKSARYQLVMVGIVDGSAENFRNVIIKVSFRLFFRFRILTFQRLYLSDLIPLEPPSHLTTKNKGSTFDPCAIYFLLFQYVF